MTLTLPSPSPSPSLEGGRDTGAKAVAQAIEENSTLRFLGLANNNIREEGCISLVHKLASNTALTQLDLSFNPLGPNRTRPQP